MIFYELASVWLLGYFIGYYLTRRVFERRFRRECPAVSENRLYRCHLPAGHAGKHRACDIYQVWK